MPYDARVEYYSFGLGKDIKVRFDRGLDQSIDGYTFERNFGMSPKGTASIFMNVPKKASTMILTIDDKVFMGQNHMN